MKAIPMICARRFYSPNETSPIDLSGIVPFYSFGFVVHAFGITVIVVYSILNDM